MIDYFKQGHRLYDEESFQEKLQLNVCEEEEDKKHFITTQNTGKMDSELEVIEERRTKNLKSVIININERKKVKYHYHLSFFFPI